MRRVLVQLLLVGLLPLLVVTSGATAEAAAALDGATTVATGPTVTGKAHTEESGWIPNDDVSCSFTGYIRLNSIGIYSVRNKTRCDFGGNFDAQDAVALRAFGGTNDGERCSFEGYYAPESGVDFDNSLIPFNLHSTDTWEDGCSITRGTVQFFDTDGGCDNGFGQPWWYDLSPSGDACPGPSVTFDWLLGTLPADPGPRADQSCPYGTPIKAWGALWKDIPSVAGSYATSNPWGRSLAMKILNPKAAGGSNDHPSGRYYSKWQMGVVYRVKDSTGAVLRTVSFWESTGDTDPYTVAFTDTVTTDGDPADFSDMPPGTYTLSDGFGQTSPGGWTIANGTSGNRPMYKAADSVLPAGQTLEIVGIGIRKWNILTSDPAYSVSPAGFKGQSSATVSTSASNGEFGVNDPAHCRFYFGEKLYNDDATTVDEPAAPLATELGTGSPVTETDPTNPAPDPTNGDDGCTGFSFTDPASWAGAGVCVMVKALKALIDVLNAVWATLVKVADLLSGLVDDIGTLLVTLFVPDPDSWDMDGLQEQLTSRPPASVVVDLGQTVQGVVQGYQDASGCGTIADFTTADGNPANDAKITCAGAKSNPEYHVLFDLAKVGILCMAGLAIFRMAAARFSNGGA